MSNGDKNVLRAISDLGAQGHRQMNIAWDTDVQQADWVMRSLRADYTVAMLIQPHFEAYARLLHSDAAPARPDPPHWGSLPSEDAKALIVSLTQFTKEQRWWFCLWSGYGFLRGLMQQDPPLTLVRGIPDREYLLYSGMPETALALIEWPFHQTPNLWWPSDRTWCVSTEVDLESTYVGGSEALISSLLENRALEAVRVHCDDVLSTT